MSVTGDRNPLTVALLSVASIVFLAMLMYFSSVARTRVFFWFQGLSSILLAYHSPTVCLVLGVSCVCFVVASLVIGGFWWSLAIAVPPCCCLCYLAWKWSLCSGLPKGVFQEEEEEDVWSIVFHGQVLEGRRRPCVCSWPGKYESAWDEMVTSCQKKGTVSAAVVFLPEGSEDYGSHDEIPEEVQNEGIHGECWCVPLYGEPKVWGCHWWTKWIANIESAVEKGAKLQVYFFKGMKGRGKVHDFSTAGKENLQRETILEKKYEDFVESPAFNEAVKGGIEELSKEKRSDGSSQYSRAKDRLFLDWLPEEERKFMKV